MFLQHADTTHTPRSNTARSSYNTFMQHTDTARKSKIKSFRKAGNK